jgi:hypothetical protein
MMSEGASLATGIAVMAAAAVFGLYDDTRHLARYVAAGGFMLWGGLGHFVGLPAPYPVQALGFFCGVMLVIEAVGRGVSDENDK